MYKEKGFRVKFILISLMMLTMIIPFVFAQEKLPPPPKPSLQSQNNDQEDDKDVIKIKQELVLIDASVIDKSNKFVKNIDKTQFQVFEDQIAQTIEFFSQEEVPISYGIVIDTSGSMRKRLSTVIKSAQTLINLSRPSDEVFIVDAKDTANIELLEDFTNNLEDAKDALDNMVAGGGSAILDSIVVSSEYAKKGQHRRKALVVVSDGDDRDSTYSIVQTLDKLSEYDVQLYFIGFPEDVSEDGGIFKTSPRKKAIELINKLTSESGGQSYFPKDLSEIEPIARKIATDLRSQYTIGYYSSNQKEDGGFRRVQVRLMDGKEKYAVRARSGYFTGKETNNDKNNKPNRSERKK